MDQRFEGEATMYMRMPLSTSTLPVEGTCTVEGKKLTLRFPFTGIEFDLPMAPAAVCDDFDFKIKSSWGEANFDVTYVRELDCYRGVGRQEDDDSPVLAFTFYSANSPLCKLRRPRPLP